MNTDLRQSERFREFQRRIGCKVVDIGGGQAAYVQKIPTMPLLSVVKVQRVRDPLDFAVVDEVCRKHRAVVVKFEPGVTVDEESASDWERRLAANSYRSDAEVFSPSRTLVVDLTAPETEILAQMKAKTRYNIGLAQRRGVKVEIVDAGVVAADSERLNEFYRVFEENARRIDNEFPLPWLKLLFETFGKDGFAAYAYLADRTLAGVAQYLIAGDMILYSYNGTTERGRHDFAANLLVWEGMLEGRRRGCRLFDFDGLRDERHKVTENWAGFTRFKQGFGGREVSYIGSFYKQMSPFRR